MEKVSKTLYIPLYGKACVSRKGIILDDKKAEELWAAEGIPLKGKAASKWLAYYMAMRSRVFDDWLRSMLEQAADAVVLHLGCGMDARCLRVEHPGRAWYDVDFPDVVQERKRHYGLSDGYHMLGTDLRDEGWLGEINAGSAIVILEGVSMYLSPAELQNLLNRLCGKFGKLYMMMDCYTELAAGLSRRHNPINSVGVTRVYGMDDPRRVACGGLSFLREHEITPQSLIQELSPGEQRIFRTLYGGKFANKLYKLYEYER